MTSEASRPKTSSVSPSSEPSYTPQAGDVVEFEYVGKTCRGLVYRWADSTLVMSDWEDASWMQNQMSICRNTRKTGDYSDVATGHTSAKAIAKAYFAKEPAADATEYKVGDLVEYKRGSWQTGVVTEIAPNSPDDDQLYRVALKGGRDYWPLSRNIRPLSGTYAERQAKWIKFHGIKVGDKVKCVRGYTADEDGCRAGAVSDGDHEYIGQVHTIVEFGHGHVDVDLCYHPYFALEPVK